MNINIVFLIIILQGKEFLIPKGWPLTLGDSGLILRLGELEASALRSGECYICVRNAATNAIATTSETTCEENTVEVSHTFTLCLDFYYFLLYYYTRLVHKL